MRAALVSLLALLGVSCLSGTAVRPAERPQETGFALPLQAAAGVPDKVPWLRQLPTRAVRLRRVPRIAAADGLAETALSLSAPADIELSRFFPIDYLELDDDAPLRVRPLDERTGGITAPAAARLPLPAPMKARRITLEPEGAPAHLAEARFYQLTQAAWPQTALPLTRSAPQAGPDGALRLACEPLEEAQGVTAAACDVLLRAPFPAGVRVRLTQSSEPERAWYQADLRLTPPAGAAAARLALVLDPPDTWCEAGETVTLTLTALPAPGGAPLPLQAGETRAGLVTGSAEEVRDEFVLSRLNWFADWYAAHTPDTPWDAPDWAPDAEPALRWLRILQEWHPRHPGVMAYAERVLHLPREKQAMAPGPENAPRWALLAHQLLKRYQYVAYWWRNTRQQPDGLYGGDPADDAVLVDTLASVPLITGDPILLAALRAGAEGAWGAAGVGERESGGAETVEPERQALKGLATARNPAAAGLSAPKGVPECSQRVQLLGGGGQALTRGDLKGIAVGSARAVPDASGDAPGPTIEKYAQAVACTQPLLLLTDPGDPVPVERCLEASRWLLDWTAVNAQGHRHFVSDHLRPDGRSPDGSSPVDVPGNALAAGPALAAFWYSGHPVLKRAFSEWALAWATDAEAPGLGALPPALQASTCRPLAISLSPHERARAQEQLLRLLLDGHRLSGNARLLRPAASAVTGGLADPLSLVLWRSLGSREIDDRLAQAPDGVDGLLGYAAWLATGSKSVIAEALQDAISQLDARRYLLTEANPRPDTVELPGNLLLRYLYLGGPGPWRGGLPRVAVTWEGTGAEFAAFVVDKRADALKVLVYNFQPQPRTVRLRVWALAAGTYTLAAGPDANQDDTPDRVTDRRQVSLHRGDGITLTMPAQQQYVIALTAAKLQPGGLLPDPALRAEEITLSPDRMRVTVPVHNLGAASATGVHVALTEEHGQTLASATLAALPWPKDARPVIQPLHLSLTRPAPAHFRVTVSCAGAEITRANNSVRVSAP